MPTGFIRAFDPKRQFGFIESDDNRKDLYFHMRHVKKKLWPRLQAKARVSYVERFVEGFPPSAQGICFLEDNQETSVVKEASKTTSSKKEQIV